MKRRTVIAAGGSAVVLGGLAAFSVTNDDDGVSTPSGIRQRNRYVPEMVVKPTDTYERLLEVDDGGYRVFETESVATDSLIDTDRVRSFVDSIDFDAATLVAAECGAGPTDEVTLSEITQTGESVTLHVDVKDKPGSDRLDIHSLLVSLRSDSPPAGEDIDVRFDYSG